MRGTRRATRGLAILALPAALAACGDYDPPVVADHRAAKYQTDLAACQDSGGKEAAKSAVAFFRSFATYPVSLPILQRRDITNCMTAKGYALSG